MRKWLGAVVALAVVGCGPVDEAAPTLPPELRIQQATVTVAGRCAGVIVADQALVLTAAHCLRPDDRTLSVAFMDGELAVTEVTAVDDAADVALLRLPSAPQLEGLPVADALPEPGTPAYFAGRFDRGATLQEVRIVKRAPCPSLPGVPEALFTSLRGTPGDSGAPVVDHDLQIVGLVHGGARCSIAAPTHEVPAMIRSLEATAEVHTAPR